MAYLLLQVLLIQLFICFSDATQKAAQVSELVQTMSAQNVQNIANSPEEFASLIKQEQNRYAQIVKESNIQAD
jgi:tripartite-type tricarboxylate transporter receptor subunit TctC